MPSLRERLLNPRATQTPKARKQGQAEEMNEGHVLGVWRAEGMSGRTLISFVQLVGMLVSFFLKYLFIYLALLGLMGHAGHLIFVVAC